MKISNVKCQSSKFKVTHQAIIVWIQETKSLLPSLCKREELPLFGKEGQGEIL